MFSLFLVSIRLLSYSFQDGSWTKTQFQVEFEAFSLEGCYFYVTFFKLLAGRTFLAIALYRGPQIADLI